MAELNKKATSGEYSVIYSNMRGVDLSGDGSTISRSRFAYAKNMYRDYQKSGGDVIETVPGFRRLSLIGQRINNIFLHVAENGTERLMIHAGNKLYGATTEEIELGKTPTPVVNCSGTHSQGATLNGQLYVFNGSSISRIDRNGTAKVISENFAQIYVPTTYVGGVQHEQRNLLTRRYKESYTVGSADTMAFGNPELTYKVTDIDERTCKITGINSDSVTNLYIPSRIKIGNDYYSVTEVGKDAFRANATVERVIIAEGVRKLGKFAFAECPSLTEVILPNTVSFIDNACFSRCMLLERLHLGLGLTAVGSSVIALCTKLSTITYAGTEEEYQKIENTSVLAGTTLEYEYDERHGSIGIPVFDAMIAVSDVSVGGVSHTFESFSDSSGLINLIKLDFDDKSTSEGKEIIISGTLSKKYAHYKDGFMSSPLAINVYPEAFLQKSRIIEVFDGRLFVSGCEYAPNVVFFSSRDSSGLVNPLYFGEYDYFEDAGENKITAMLATENALAIFKTGNTGTGDISYRTRMETGIDIAPVTYSVSSIQTGVPKIYSAAHFFDDELFLSESGVMGLDKRQLNLNKSLSCRSDNVNALLLGENLSLAKTAVWCGYFVIAVGGRIYLADSRATYTNALGGKEYEWFLLEGIGSYSGDHTVYRYSSVSVDGFLIKDTPGEVAPYLSVFSDVASDGRTVYYSYEGDNKYLVHPTEEREGGVFSPVSAVFSDGERLYFGTESGNICIFNNDMRGKPPMTYYLAEDFDERAYKERYGRSIDASHYSFMGHPISCALKTALDNGGIPHLAKSTVKHSLTVKCKTSTRGRVIIEAHTDGGGYREICDFPSAALAFDNLDFSSLALCCEDSYTRSVAERERGYCEKQLSLYSTEYCSPIAIYNLAYRFKIKGRIKKK